MSQLEALTITATHKAKTYHTVSENSSGALEFSNGVSFTPPPNMDSNSLDSVRAQNTDRGLFSLPEELILNISELVLATGRTKDKKAMRHTCSTLRRVVPNSVLGGVVSEREVLRRNIETNGVSCFLAFKSYRDGPQANLIGFRTLDLDCGAE